VRLQEFWARVRDELGEVRGEAIARDHVFSAFGGRTAVGAIDDGIPVRDVGLALCEEFDVPAQAR
jgi:hypothetical protein